MVGDSEADFWFARKPPEARLPGSMSDSAICRKYRIAPAGIGIYRERRSAVGG
jgi:hypothetical protein